MAHSFLLAVMLASVLGEASGMAPTMPGDPPVDARADDPSTVQTEAHFPPATPETPDQIVSIETDRYARMTVPVTIEGQGPFYFMIDTGAQATVVTRDLARKLDLDPIGSATIVGMGSRREAQIFQLDGLEFADRLLDNIRAPMLEARNIGADGILGLDSLQDLRVLIDFRSDTIAVNDADLLGGNRGYEIVVRARRRLGRLIITDAIIDRVPTAVILDTGAQTSFGNRELKNRLRARALEEVSSTDVNGALVIGNVHRAKLLKIQRLNVVDLPITFADSPAFEALGLADRPALILGMREMRMFDRVAIDFAKRRVLFDLPSRNSRRKTLPRTIP